MWQDPDKRYHFKLHHCEQDDHYHFITSIDSISWPFWSREAGLKLADYSISLRDRAFLSGKISGEELEFEVREFDRLRSEVLSLRALPRRLQYHEGNVALFWSSFLRGENPYMCYMDLRLGATLLFPLYCDFIHRQEPRPKGALSRTEWIQLAEKPVARNTMEELGITLELAE